VRGVELFVPLARVDEHALCLEAFVLPEHDLGLGAELLGKLLKGVLGIRGRATDIHITSACSKDDRTGADSGAEQK
jgi:hypothetical protein